MSTERISRRGAETAEGVAAPGPRRLIAAVHGILTRQTVASWPDKFAVWMDARDPSVRVVEKEYLAGPFPPWNVWAKNWLLAYALAAELELWARDGREISIVAHSNGCDIAQKTARELARRGVEIEALVLIAGAAQSDVDKSGIADLFRRGFVERAIAYSSPRDRAVSNVLIWPYGHLGSRGWTLNGQPYGQPYGEPITPHESAPESCIVTRLFPQYGHCDYFSDALRDQTCERIYQDVCNPCPF